MPSSGFNIPSSKLEPGILPVTPDEWSFFTTVSKTRTQFIRGTKILIAIGGWGDDEGFEIAARTAEGQKVWAGNVARMVTDTGADGS